jgi:hypothetical protein
MRIEDELRAAARSRDVPEDVKPLILRAERLIRAMRERMDRVHALSHPEICEDKVRSS